MFGVSGTLMEVLAKLLLKPHMRRCVCLSLADLNECTLYLYKTKLSKLYTDLQSLELHLL